MTFLHSGPSADASPVTRFTTAAAPIHDRITLWEEYNEEELFGLRCSTFSDRSLMATQTNLNSGQIRLTHIQGNDHVIERRQSDIRTNPAEAVMLCMLLRGDAFLYHGAGCDTLSAGDAVVYDADRPFMYGFSSDMSMAIVEVPKNLVAQSATEEEMYRPRVIRLAGTGGETQAQVISKKVTDALRQGKKLGAASENSIVEAFHLLTGSQERAGEGLYWDMATAFVKSRLFEDLSVGKVAQAIGISPRHLTRIFTKKGTTPARFIMEYRMKMAAKLLQDSSLNHLSIGKIGTRIGLQQPSHFSRVFKEHFGMNPTDFRAGKVLVSNDI